MYNVSVDPWITNIYMINLTIAIFFCSCTIGLILKLKKVLINKIFKDKPLKIKKIRIAILNIILIIFVVIIVKPDRVMGIWENLNIPSTKTFFNINHIIAEDDPLTAAFFGNRLSHKANNYYGLVFRTKKKLNIKE